MRWLTRLCVALGFAAGLFSGTDAAAQSGGESVLRTLVRGATVTGLPPLEIDLDGQSAQRYALVIGYGEYGTAADLPNAIADAKLVADMLERAGYSVAEHYNLSKRGFEAALRQALYEMEFGAEFFFYYAGHGVQIGNGNYLIPTDMVPGSVHDVPMSTVSLSGIMAATGARSRSVTVVLDSCRDNPFPRQQGAVTLDGTPQSLRSGFTAPDTPINSLLIFSTSPGALALDGENANSPFTRAFVDVLSDNPERPIDELMKDVRRRVYRTTQKLQVPWSSSSLVEPIVLGTASDLADLPSAVAAETVRVTGPIHPNVPVGDAIAEAAGDEAPGLAIVKMPERGRVAMQTPTGKQALVERQFMAKTDVGQLIYTTQFGGTIKSGTEDHPPHSDSFTVQIGGQQHTVDISLAVDPCDRAAGDHLDPDSVGVGRYPNEIEPVFARDACRAAIARAPDVGRFHYQLGRALMALKDFAGAEAAFSRAAELGHTRAYHGLGTLLMTTAEASGGQGRQAAPESAMALLLKGVMRGDPYAYHTMGLQLMRFPRVDSDVLNGFDLLSRSVELGHTFSMNALGLYFLDEDAAHYDPERGLRYLQESAARADIYGYNNLGFVALNGVGGQPVDLQQAEEWFRKAARGGHPSAATALGRMYTRGQIGGRADLRSAITWYDQGLERGDAWGGANAAWLIANRAPRGYTGFDAAVRAAKAATMQNAKAAQSAEEVLAGLSRRDIDGGAQALMRDLGADVTVDGAFGPASRTAADQLARQFGRTLSPDPQERLKALAKLYWEQTKFRVDLY
jgi:TPR repeat protein